MSTIKALAQLIDREAELDMKRGVRVTVKIIDAKIGYGHPRLLVDPLNGSEPFWVDAAKVQPAIAR